MKIGFFTDVYTPQIDGVVKAIQLYKKTLEYQGHEVFVFAPKEIKNDMFSKWHASSEEKNVFRFQALDSVFVPGYPFTLPLSFRATRRLPKLSLDIVHCHTPFTLGMLGNIVALFENVPQIFTYHTFYSEYAKHYLAARKLKISASKIAKKLEVFYCDRADLVIAPSTKLKKFLEEIGVKSEISVLPTGIDFDEFRKKRNFDFRKRYKIPKNKKVLLFVGRLGTEKNVGFLIEMMSKLIQKEKDVHLVIIGDGKDRQNLERKTKKANLQKYVLFTGFLPHDETISAFLASNIFVFASKTDTQGLVLFEAAAAGKPIVMINDPGLSKIVENNRNGFITSESTDQFSNCIVKLLQNKSLYDKMAKNSQIISKNFTIEEQTKKLVNLYQKQIISHRGASWRNKFWKSIRHKIKTPFLF